MDVQFQPASGYFDSRFCNGIYKCSNFFVGLFKKSLDLMLPAIQLVARKEPTYQNAGHLTHLKKFALAIPGAALVLVTSPLLGVAKLAQSMLKSRMHNAVLEVSPAETKVASTVSLATCNVIGLPNAAFMLGDKPNGELAAKRLPKIANVLKREDADIVCLQECFDLEAQDKMVAALKPNYQSILHHIGENRPFALGSGLLIASKYPITACHFVEFPNRLGIDKIASKGVAFAKLDLGERRVGYVATTHMQANAGDDKLTAEVRALQAAIIQDEMEKFVKATSKEGEVITLKAVLGDFNFDNHRTNRPFLDRQELENRATFELFKRTLDPVVDRVATERGQDWQRPVDPDNCGTALRFKNLQAHTREELDEEIEEHATRRLDYTLFYRDCHAQNQSIESSASIVRSDSDRIITDHLMIRANVTYLKNAAAEPTRCSHTVNIA